MNPEAWQQVSRIFKSALSLAPEARAAYVQAECGGDEPLRREVDLLIDSHQRASEEHFIDSPPVEGLAPLFAQEDEEEPKTSALEKGQKIGNYIVLDKIGAGGMGEVYLATDTRLDRNVALKILPADVAADKQRMQRFGQEARIASALNQPNILTIFEFGEADSLHFLATEYIDGQTLRDYLRGKQPSLTEILEISMQIVAALDAAHEAKIVHRDIKPENVMIRRRDHIVKVLDFGLAKLSERTSPSQIGSATDTEAATEFKTKPGSVMGTINYMSPEQAQGLPVDGRTDIWSIGVVIYEMVVGSVPFKGATSSHTVVEVLEKDAPPLSQSARIKVPTELERIVRKALAKNPDERYQTAKDMLIDLRNLKKQLDWEAEIQRSTGPDPSATPVITSPVTAVRTTATVASAIESGGQPKRHTSVVLGIVLALTAVVAGTVLGLKFWPSARSKLSASAPVTLAERKLTYSITVQKYRNNKPFEYPFQLAKEILFERNYQIRLQISSPESGYLYVLNEGPHEKDQAPELVVLFPSPTSNSNSALVTENRKLQIPEESWFRLDNEKGTEKVWLIFATNAIPELEPVRVFANPKTRGLINDPSLRDAVQSFLKTHSDSKATAEQNEERKETTLAAKGDILVHVIQLEHY